MASKIRVASHLSIRVKFKDSDHVELVIIDSDTNQIWALLYAFREDKILAVKQDNETEIIEEAD